MDQETTIQVLLNEAINNYNTAGNPEETRTLCAEAIKQLRASFGIGHPRVLTAKNLISQLLDGR